jgi:chromosome partitioning protein
MLRWLASNGQPDARYFLRDALDSPEVQNAFDVILIDAPPRLTTGAINALVASTHFLVPTKLDGLSAETMGSFLRQVAGLKAHMKLDLSLAGVVGMMTPSQPLTSPLRPANQDALGRVRTSLRREWRDDEYVFKRDIQERASISNAAGKELSTDAVALQMFKELGDELSSRLRLT